MTTLQSQSEEGFFIVLNFERYTPTFSAPFTFSVEININGFQCGYSKTVGHQYIQLSHEAIFYFVAELERLQSTTHAGATLSDDDQRFHLTVEPYGKRGYLLIRTALSFQVQPAINDSTLIDTRFDGGFVVESAQLSEWITTMRHVMESYIISALSAAVYK